MLWFCRLDMYVWRLYEWAPPYWISALHSSAYAYFLRHTNHFFEISCAIVLMSANRVLRWPFAQSKWWLGEARRGEARHGTSSKSTSFSLCAFHCFIATSTLPFKRHAFGTIRLFIRSISYFQFTNKCDFRPVNIWIAKRTTKWPTQADDLFSFIR